MQRLIGLVLLTFVMFSVAAAAHEPALPKVDGPIPNTSTSHAFLSSDHLKQPIDLSKYGYIEEEYLISGDARVFGWPDKSDPPVPAATGSAFSH